MTAPSAIPPVEPASAVPDLAPASAVPGLAPDPTAFAFEPGTDLPGFETEPISRLALALYCGASGDHNPIHVDLDFAREAGQPDVFAHGMLSMAWLGRVLTNWVPQSQLREFGVRFVSITPVGERLRCEGRTVEKFEADGEERIRVTVSTHGADGSPRLVGDAVIALAPACAPPSVRPRPGTEP